MTRTGLLVTSYKDVALTNDYPESTWIAMDYLITQLFPKKEFQYFFKNKTYSNDLNYIPYKIAHNWYRDNKGIDISSGPYSVGMVLEHRLNYILSNLINYYYAFKYWVNKNDIIYVPKTNNTFFNILCDNFIDNIKYINGNYEISPQIDIFIKNKCTIRPVNIKKKSYIAKLIQKMLFIKNTNKVMVFPDWTYKSLKHKNYIYFNSYNLFNGFYMDNNPNTETIVNDSISKIPEISNTLDDIICQSFPNDDIESFASLIKQNIQYEYINAIKNTNRIFSLFTDVISTYKPKSIVIPDYGISPWYNIIAQIAEQHNIKLYSVIDGFHIFMQNWTLKKNRKGNNNLIKNFASMGSMNDSFLKKYINHDNVINIQTPLANNLEIKKNTDIIYDAIILMPYCWNSVNADDDKRYKYLFDVIKVLKSININKIAIKFKEGKVIGPNDTGEKIVTEQLINLNKYKNISLISGSFSDYVNKTKIVIGQVGTSLIESVICETPYFLYEPIENGLYDYNFINSMICDKSYAKNISDLKKNILSNNCVELVKDKIVDGKSINLVIN
tara:strand:+ start:2013 stop:3680 length:1668 start_codon:yes stop_codon:yes gene_type:complete